MKIKFFATVMLMLFSFTTVMAAPANEGIQIKVSKRASAQDAARAKELQLKLDSIQALDFNSLSAQEQAEVKAEIKDIKKEVRKMDGVYIYLGGGVLLVIILLLILL